MSQDTGKLESFTEKKETKKGMRTAFRIQAMNWSEMLVVFGHDISDCP